MITGDQQNQDNYSLIRMHGLGDVLREHSRSRPKMTAVVDGDYRFDWPSFEARVNQTAAALQSQGVKQGGRVLWLAQNSFRLLELVLASAKIGAMVCPVNWRQSPAEMAVVIDDFAPNVVFWQRADVGAAFEAAKALSSHRCEWIQHDDNNGVSAYETLIACFPSVDVEQNIHPDTPIIAMYTAAFDGRPNAALLSQSAFLYQSLMIAYGHWITDSSSYLNSGPLFHLGTMMSTFAIFCFGGKNVFVPRVDAEEMLQLIDAERITHAFVVQPTVEQIRKINADGKYDVSSLWSAPDVPEYFSPMVMPVDAPFNKEPRVYGQTEVMGFVTMGWLGGAGAGRSSPLAQVKIVDNSGNEVATGETGEIVVRGPQVMSGYLNRPEENQRRSELAWHRTHDLGKRLDDGAIAFVGPKTVMIKSGVENIYPAEVEACLRELPAVKDACIIGVPDPKWSQNVKAIIVIHEGQNLTEDDVINHCKERLASYKKPKTVTFVEALPRGTDGQLNRSQADELYGGGGYPFTA